jgi:hypothetical protein
MNTMTSVKTLMFAAAAALSIGVGSAMASGSGVAGPDYWAAQQQAAARQQAANPNARVTPAPNDTTQYGSSDFEKPMRVGPDSGLAGASGGF